MRALLFGLEGRVGFQVDARRPILTSGKLLVGRKRREDCIGKGEGERGNGVGIRVWGTIALEDEVKEERASLGVKLRPRWA